MLRIITTFGDAPTVHEIREGGTLQEFMLEQNPDIKNFPVPVVAWKDGNVLMRKDWPLAELHGADEISITALPRPLGGGGGVSLGLDVKNLLGCIDFP